MDYINLYDVAKQLNVSHTTIYNKLKNKEIYKDLKPFIKKEKNVTYIHSKGIEELKKYITIKVDNKVYNKVDSEVYKDDYSTTYNKLSESIDNLQTDYISSLKDYIKTLENQINEKDKQLDAKDKQLESKDNLLSENNKLLQNMQVLLNNYNKKQIVENIEQNKKWWKFWDKN